MLRTVFAMAVAALGFRGRFRDFASRADRAAATGVTSADIGTVTQVRWYRGYIAALLAWTAMATRHCGW